MPPFNTPSIPPKLFLHSNTPPSSWLEKSFPLSHQTKLPNGYVLELFSFSYQIPALTVQKKRVPTHPQSLPDTWKKALGEKNSHFSPKISIIASILLALKAFYSTKHSLQNYTDVNHIKFHVAIAFWKVLSNCLKCSFIVS